MLIYQISNYLILEHIIEFKLRGKTGYESAIINLPGKDSQIIPVTTEWADISLSLHDTWTFEIFFQRFSKQEILYFDPAYDFDIRHQYKWKQWRCEEDDGEKECEDMEEGILKWTGTYNIRYDPRMKSFDNLQYLINGGS